MLLTSKVWSDLKEKYALAVFWLLINLLSAPLSDPQCASQLISNFHPHKPHISHPNALVSSIYHPPVSLSLHPAYTAHPLLSSSSSHLYSLLSFAFRACFLSQSPRAPHWRSLRLSLSLSLSPLLYFRPITSGCGSMGRPRPRPIAGWSWRNPSRSSWISLATSRCSSLESCSTCPVFPGWSRKPPGKDSTNTHLHFVTCDNDKLYHYKIRPSAKRPAIVNLQMCCLSSKCVLQWGFS